MGGTQGKSSKEVTIDCAYMLHVCGMNAFAKVCACVRTWICVCVQFLNACEIMHLIIDVYT